MIDVNCLVCRQLRQEILEVYRQLHHLVMELKGTGDKWSPEAIQLGDMKVGSLLTVLKDLRDVVFATLHRYADRETQDVSCTSVRPPVSAAPRCLCTTHPRILLRCYAVFMIHLRLELATSTRQETV